MKLHILSDIHLERYRLFPGLHHFIKDPSSADYICLCGDIGDIHTDVYEDILYECAKTYKCVFVILGNHEYHYGSIESTHAQMQTLLQKLNCSNIYWLNNTGVDLEEVNLRVIGTTLWTEVKGSQRLYVQQSIADFRVIDNWDIEQCNETYKKNLEFLKREVELSKCENKRLIVLTHHAPLAKCGNPAHRGSMISSAFKNDLEAFIIENEETIAAWIYGHDHWSMENYVGSTRVISNQYGYPREVCGYDSELCITIT